MEGEIIVVDNASSEDCAARVRENFPKIKLISNEVNLGFSKAMNQGAREASGEYLLLLNPDIILPEDGLKKALEYAQEHPDMGALGCRFIDGSGKLLPECKRNVPGIGAALAKLVGLDWGYYANHLEERQNGEVEVLTGAFMFLKRDLFERLSGFDEQFFMFGEDIDLSYRIEKSGHKNRYLGSLTIVHFKGESSVKNASYLRHFYGAMEIFYIKHFRNNAMGRTVLRMLVWSAIRSKNKPAAMHSDRPNDALSSSSKALYLGSRNTVYQALKKKLGTEFIEKVSNPDQVSDSSFGRIFIDVSSLSYKKVIETIESLPLKVSKRIITQKGDCYIGSDSATNQGESERLQA